ncbi:hypothetical protein C0J52_00281 [Blattella germanica]|nr:hypothetical protein C0J52_00281 [Blattella germanica]
MPPVHTELVRRAIRIVCEMVIAELREILLQKKRRLLEIKAKKTSNASRAKTGRATTQPINFEEGVSEGQSEPQVDPWANITIKEEIHDEDDNELTFEEHIDGIKTEVKEEDLTFENTYGEPQEHTTVEASSSASGSKVHVDQQEGPAAKKRRKENVSDITHDDTKEEEPLPSSSFESVFPEETEKPYVCKQCLKTFATFDELKEHDLLHKSVHH